ncbi:MarR family winged helix-turn-helix transcriptional regulator [Burkholderia orbicola]|uniref:MarR family winged helix-turn-helix transcriptional regulator n=1 Tax=Burkholderia orbicola TaxID=2978683 RepID=UPI0039A59F13
MKHYTEDNFEIPTGVGFSINKARNIIVAELDHAMEHLDISAQHIGIMLCLLRGAPNTPFEMARLLHVDTGLMTRMLDKLETKGLLVRTRSVEDRRVVHLALTLKGRQIARQIPELALGVLNDRLKHFTKAEFAEFRRLLDKFNGD